MYIKIKDMLDQSPMPINKDQILGIDPKNVLQFLLVSAHD